MGAPRRLIPVAPSTNVERFLADIDVLITTPAWAPTSVAGDMAEVSGLSRSTIDAKGVDSHCYWATGVDRLKSLRQKTQRSMTTGEHGRKGKFHKTHEYWLNVGILLTFEVPYSYLTAFPFRLAGGLLLGLPPLV